MKKNLKILLGNDKYDITIDSLIYKDYKLEACTQIIERLFKLGINTFYPFIFCEELIEKSNKVDFRTYNTYKIMINAGYYTQAELFRKICLIKNKIDLASEPIQSMH